MSRILDALRKSQPPGPGPAPLPPLAPEPVPAPERPGGPAAHASGPPMPAAILPLPLGPGLPEDLAREMQTLRVNLESALGARSPRVVMFMSSQPGEGATTIAVQFARTLARDPALRVLLVDTHVRRPGLTEAFGDASWNPPGPASPGAHGQLALLPLPAAQLGAGVFQPALARRIVDETGPSYDWVVLDGPPLLEAPDAAALGAVSDGVVLVVQAGRTKKPVLARAVDLLRKSGANVVGTVLNRRRMEIPGFIYRRI